MRRGRVIAPLVALALATSACTGDGGSPGPSPEPSRTAAPTPTDPAPSPSPSPGPTTPAGATCDRTVVLATVASSLVAARLTPVADWAADVEASPFADRTASGDVYAGRLGLDCGLVAAEALTDGSERLLIAAWTGPRMAWVVQTTEEPATPYAPEATVTVVVGDAEGEYLDGGTRAVWAGTLASGETFVVGHVDFSLGAAAKDWVADLRPVDGPSEDGLLASERHGIAVLEAAGMREVGIAEPAQIGSEEGHLMFVSPTGQVSVADVGPTGWFDPMTPRYYQGATRFETIDGAQVRVTEPGPDDAFPLGAEVGFACDAFVWLLQPPLNGGVDEMLETATAILATAGCRG